MLSAVKPLSTSQSLRGDQKGLRRVSEDSRLRTGKKDFEGEEGNSTNALRHRLAHGRYFTTGDGWKTISNFFI
jgi:hypothetical protein